MMGLVLLFVGAVMVLNGIWLFGRIGDNEIAVINFFAGGLGLLAALDLALVKGDPVSILGAANFLLFAFTYLWVAVNKYNGSDNRGLGWYCLFVAVTAVPTGYLTLTGASTLWAWWLGIDWLLWALLWFLYFVLLALQKPITKLTASLTLLEGIFTCWVPAYLQLNGLLK